MANKKPYTFLAFFTLLILTTVLITAISVKVMAPRDWHAHDQPHGHTWLIETLNLTEAEAAAINVFESPYQLERARLQKEFDQQVKGIANLLQSKDEFGPEVVHAIHELHLVHGQLQELSIRHYYDMLNAISPEKRPQLRMLAVEALSTPQ